MFVTGGVGGVHRGGEASLDVSADLVELGRSRVPVVSAGVKSILDIGRTLEFLVRSLVQIYRVSHPIVCEISSCFVLGVSLPCLGSSQGCDVWSHVSGLTKRTNPIWICIWFGDTKFTIFL